MRVRKKDTNGKNIARQVTDLVGTAVGVTAHGVTRTARRLTRVPRISKGKPGAPAGITPAQLAQLPSTDEPVRVSCIDYSPQQVLVQDNITDIEDFILHHRPEWSVVRWINVDGLTDMSVIQALAEKYELHPLAIEDMLHAPQRPKVDQYGEGRPGESDKAPARLFIVLKMLQIVDGHLYSEQISFFVGHKTVLTFQQRHGDVWNPIRARLNKSGSQLRQSDAGFLTYALIDAIIDECFPILEQYGDRLEDLEHEVLERPETKVIGRVHQLRRELLLLRREVWPMREVIHTLQREPHECMTDLTRMYLRDVYDHTVQIIDLIETYREFAGGLTETYMSSLSIRMNEVMKVLTIMGTIFIPLTFLAGVWGMNFKDMPETNSEWNYPWLYPIGFWSLCIALAVGMLVWFKKRKWL